MIRQRACYLPPRLQAWAAIRGGVFGPAMVLAVVLSWPQSASAQTSSNQDALDPVVINWDALGGAGSSAMPASAMPMPSAMSSSPGRMLMPGLQPPVSKLYVAVPGGSAKTVTLKKPSAAAAKAAASPKAPATSMTMATAPAAPAPAPMPVKKVAKAAPEPPATAKPTKLAKRAAPPPPPSSASAPPPPPSTPSAPEPAPALKAGKAPDAPKPATETATAPTTTDADKAGGTVQLLFNAADTKLSADAKTALDAIAAKLQGDEGLRVQLMAFAFGDGMTSSTARRVSLSRALATRSHLIEKGVRSTRIDVRALGDKAENQPKNRVDVSFVGR